MTDNIFDDFVRSKLKDHPSPVPQGLWEKIERKKDKDPKGGFWLSKTTLLSGLLFILISLCIGYFLLKDNATTPPANNNQVSETAAAKNNGSATGTNTPLNQKHNSVGNLNDSTNSNDANNKTENTASIKTQTENKITGSDKNKIADNNKDNSAGVAVITQSKKHHQSKTKTSINSIKHIAPVNETSVADNNAAALNKINSKIKVKKTAVMPANISNIDFAADNNEITAVTPVNESMILTKGKTAYGLRSFNSNEKTFDLSQLKIWGIDCPTTGKPRRNDWYLEVYGSPDADLKSVTAKTNASFVKKKDSTESTQLGYTAGFRISKSITDNLLLKAGLQYSQINERFDLRTENERRITTVITIKTVTTPAGTDTTIRDTTTLMQIGYSVRRTYNRYRSVDVPILLSYEFGNDKLKFAVNAGVVLNLRSWYIGETLNDSMAVVSLNSKSTPIYKQNIGVGLYAGFSILKPVSNNLDVFIEPYFRYNLSNMATGSAYTQKFNAAGLSFGIRYKLFGQRRPGN